MDINNRAEWVRCPVCGNKTRLQIRVDTELKNFPLYCPKCKQKNLINAKDLKVTVTVPPEEERQIGVFGQRHLRYLREYRKVTYINLLTSGRLNSYLAEIDGQAQERFERLIEGMKQAQSITEQLKAENALEWTGRMNNIRACAMEIVEKEIIFA